MCSQFHSPRGHCSHFKGCNTDLETVTHVFEDHSLDNVYCNETSSHETWGSKPNHSAISLKPPWIIHSPLTAFIPTLGQSCNLPSLLDENKRIILTSKRETQCLRQPLLFYTRFKEMFLCIEMTSPSGQCCGQALKETEWGEAEYQADNGKWYTLWWIQSAARARSGVQEANCIYGWVQNSPKGSEPTKGDPKDLGVKGASKDPMAGAVSLYHYCSTQAPVRRKLTFQEAIQVPC